MCALAVLRGARLVAIVLLGCLSLARAARSTASERLNLFPAGGPWRASATCSTRSLAPAWLVRLMPTCPDALCIACCFEVQCDCRKN